MTKRKLPLLLERHLGQVASDRTRLGEQAERNALDRGSLSCKAGCAACCHYPVHVSIAEGILLYRALAARGRWTTTLKTRLQAHWDKVGLMAPEVWFLAEIACPLLEQNRCMAHGARPMVCRTTVSHGLPELCHPHRIGQRLHVAPQPPETMEFTAQTRQKLRQHGVTLGLLPVSLAVLLGERLVRSEIDIGDVDREVYAAYTSLT